MTIKIDKDVPMPMITARKKHSFPWEDMAPGDSFFVPCSDGADLKRKRFAVMQQAHRRELKVATRVIKGGFRVWKL